MMITDAELNDVKLELGTEEEGLVNEVLARKISVTSFVESMNMYGLTVERMADDHVVLSMDLNNGASEATVTFKVS